MAMNLDAAFSALSDPTRRAIIAQLALGDATVNELVAPFPLSQPTISKHLKVLEQAGLIERRIEGNKRPCHLVRQGFDEIDHWLAMLKKAFEANYSRLDALLNEMEPKEKEKSK